MRALSKLLDLSGKYAWVVFFTTGFVLFLPDDSARHFGILDLRNTHKGIWWIVLVLNAALWMVAAFRYLDGRIFDEWLKGRREARELDEAQHRIRESLALRLRSLDLREQMWIKCSLFYNVQTLSAATTDPTANSLHDKGIVNRGTGHVETGTGLILNSAFHLPDPVWQYLLEYKDEFLPVHQRTKAFHEELLAFRRSLGP
jgi:Super-infection exclusion protein B